MINIKELSRKYIGGIKSNWIFLLQIMLCVLLIYIHSLSAGHYVNFSAINGTFQNFNPIRRLLDGQIPYSDFQDYLGMGHLYIGAMATILFGGTYRSSLIGFTFITLASFAGISYVIGKVNFKKKEIALALTNLIMLVLLIQPLIFSNAFIGMEEIRKPLNAALSVGNSARFVRGMILPISCGLLYIGKAIVDNILKCKKTWKYAIIVGVIAGMCFAWSNDYGISCWLCIMVMTFWYSLCKTRKLLSALKYTGIELISSLVGLFLIVEIFTLGNFNGWLSATFGTGGYQQWYYNSDKSFYLWDIDMSFPIMLQATLCIYYLLMMFFRDAKECNKEKFLKNTILAYMNMTCICAVEEYKLLSGGNAWEISMSVLFLTIVYEIISVISKEFDNKRVQHVLVSLSFIVGGAWLISSVKDEILFEQWKEKSGVYVEALDGNMTAMGNDLLKTDEFLNGEKFFSTYASGQEVISGIYQPSGTDYIIHVLGDSQRDAYLEAFKEGDFKYTATIRETYSDYEYWVQRANWFFYRELYKGWHPVFANAYDLYWERNTVEEKNIINEGIIVEVVDINDATKKIIIRCDTTTNGIADVFIDYKVTSKSNISTLFNFQRMLKVVNTGTVYSPKGTLNESNYLRAESAEYVPVRIVNGYGEITITANPDKSNYLELYAYGCNTIYTVTSNYIEVSDIQQDNVDSLIIVPNTEKNKNAVVGIKAIAYEGVESDVINVTQDETNIYIRINKEITMMDDNIIKLLR